jgi:hypothetical protein
MSDPELDAMAAVAGAIGELDEAARGRVLRWAGERYGVEVTRSDPSRRKSRDTRDEEEEPDPNAEDGHGRKVPAKFEHFAELFNAVQPKTDSDKALTAAYWFQVIKGQPSFQSLELNRELKSLGHPIGNVTTALLALQTKKPTHVMQLKKSGTSKQARKTFKLTSEGINVIEKALN